MLSKHMSRLRLMLTFAMAALTLSLASPAFAAGGGEGHEHVVAPHYLADVNNNGVADWRDWDCKQRFDGKEKIPTGCAEDVFQLESILKHAFNFFLLIVLLTYAVRQPLTNYLAERAKTIRAELEDGQALLDAANAREQEIAGRLAKLEATLAQISADADTAAANDKVALLERARSESERITENAERNIRDEVARARTTLQRQAVELAVELAEQTLRGQVSQDDQRRLARDLLNSLSDSEVKADA
jgi:F-type H+-transporting ATPase subunit b